MFDVRKRQQKYFEDIWKDKLLREQQYNTKNIKKINLNEFSK